MILVLKLKLQLLVIFKTMIDDYGFNVETKTTVNNYNFIIK